MNSKSINCVLRVAVAILLMAQYASAIKIVVPDQYKDQVESIKKAERNEREQELQGDVPAAEGEGMSLTSSEQPAEKPKVDADAFLLQSVVEATATASQFEGTLAANEGIVAGQVVDKESGAPISGTAIILEGTDIATVTAEDGRYSLGPAPAGSYTLSFIKSGYIEANVTDYKVAGGEVSVFPFALPPRPVEMSDEVYELQDFTVTAEEANNLMLQLELQMNSDNLLSALSSEDFSKFAASDIGEAIKRVSGVSVVGGKYAVIRGLGDRYVSSTLNGLPIASPDPDRQAVQLDLFPSGLFETLEVTKTYTPDQSANSTGGINMKIKDLPEEFFATLSTSVGGHSIATGNDNFLTSGRVSSQDRWANGAEARSLPEEAKEFPADLNITVLPPFLDGGASKAKYEAALVEASAITDSLGRNMHAFGDSPEIDHGFKFSAGHSGLFYNDRIRLGTIGGLNYSRKARMIEDADYFRSYTDSSAADSLSPEAFVDPTRATGYEKKKRTVSTYTSALSWLLGFGLEFDEKHSLRIHRLDLSISEDENARLYGDAYNEFASEVTDPENDSIVQEYAETLLYQERRLVSDQILGDHSFELPTNFFFDDLQVDWALSQDKASQDEPGFIQTRAVLNEKNGNFTIKQNLSASGNDPESQFAIWREIAEEKESRKLDFSFDRDIEGSFQTRFSFGILKVDTERSVFDEYVSFRNTPLPNAEFPSGSLGNDPLSGADSLLATGYDVSAEVDLETESDGRYLMIDQTLFEDLRVIGGYRYEKNSAAVQVDTLNLRGAGQQGKALFDNLPKEGGYDVDKWYPGINIIYSVFDDLNVRVAYSNTIALPSAREVSPYASSAFQGAEVDVGNPNLKPSEVESYDVGLSYLNDKGDAFSVTFFWKTVNQRIEKLQGLGMDIVSDNSDPFDLSSYPNRFTRAASILGGVTLQSWYNNPAEAQISGIEFDGRKNLAFLGDWLQDFSVGGNYTLIEGAVDRFPVEIASKNSVSRPVSGNRALTEQPESILNFDVTYDNPELGLRASLIYYHISDVLESVSMYDSYDFYRSGYGQLDLTLSKSFGENIKLSFSAKNITDTLRETYYDVEGLDFEGDSYRVGTSYSLSASYEF